MAGATMTVTVGPHDFPAGTVAGVYRCALSQAGGAPLVQLVPYPGPPPAVGQAGPPVSATFPSVSPGMYMADCGLIAADGTTVLWSIPSVPVTVPAPAPNPVTLQVPVSIAVTITVGPTPAVGKVG